jgi:hypothetical protein
MQRNSDKYVVNVFCLNCHFRGEIEVLMGTKVQHMLCPECRCAALEKDLKAKFRED